MSLTSSAYLATFFEDAVSRMPFSFDFDLISSALGACFFTLVFGGLWITTPLGPDLVFLGDIFAGVRGFLSSTTFGAACIFYFETFSLLFFYLSTISAIITSEVFGSFLKMIGSGDALYYFEFL